MSKLNRFSCLIILISALIFNVRADNWAYLGQTPPDTLPERFGGSGYLANDDWQWHGAPVFSPSGKEMFFAKYIYNPGGTEIWYSKFENNQWLAPVKAPFSSSSYQDTNPCFAGNDTLYFKTQRSNYYNIYRVIKNTSGTWSQPVPINFPILSGFSYGLQFSRAKNGNIYSELSNLQTNNEDIYFWKMNSNGQYANPQKIVELASDSLDFCPFVDPYERFILFSSMRAGKLGRMDIYISYKNQDNSWSEPQNLGTTINENFNAFPSLSPDGKYLFFSTRKSQDQGANAYWVKADKLFSRVGIDQQESRTPASAELFQNYPNPFNPSTTIQFSLPKEQFAAVHILNTKGELVAKLGNRTFSAGLNTLQFDCSSLNSGQYFYQLITGQSTSLKKMLVVK